MYLLCETIRDAADLRKQKKHLAMTTQTTYTVQIQNLKSGETFCENQFDTHEEAVEFMNSYPDSDNMQYRVIPVPQS